MRPTAFSVSADLTRPASAWPTLRNSAELKTTPMKASRYASAVRKRPRRGRPICDQVGIIQRGHLVAIGTVDELRGQGPTRLWVDAPAAAPTWAERLPGVRVERTEGSRSLLELDGSTDDQSVLRAVSRPEPCVSFGATGRACSMFSVGQGVSRKFAT